MSSLKYIFVIQGNALVRLPVESNEAAIEEKAAEQYFTDEEGTRILPKDIAVEATVQPKPRNKRNTTSRGK